MFRTQPRYFPEFDAALPGWKLADVVGSPYSIAEYVPDPHVGTFAELDALHQKLRQRGMGLILDFVPNHTGFDHPWISTHPDYYIRGTEADFRQSPGAFFLIEAANPQFIACGKDPYFPPWTDVAQANHFNPECRSALLNELRKISQHCDGVRCDMAMLVTNQVFARTWERFLGGSVVPQTEFWSEAVAALPGFVWIAEVYWDMEWQMQQLGFQFTYDKRLYDRLRESSPAAIRGHLRAEVSYQKKLVRFLENHDESRSAAVFGHERVAGLALLISTLPGMRFFHHGQLDGAKVHTPMPLGRAMTEPIDEAMHKSYERILHFADADVFHRGQWKLLEINPAGDGTFEDLIAYAWQDANTQKLVVINLRGQVAQGLVVQAGDLGDSPAYVYRDELSGVDYTRTRADLASDGLYVKLGAVQAHLFSIRGTSPA